MLNIHHTILGFIMYRTGEVQSRVCVCLSVMAGEGLLSLRWNNHRTSFMQVLSSLWDKVSSHSLSRIILPLSYHVIQ